MWPLVAQLELEIDRVACEKRGSRGEAQGVSFELDNLTVTEVRDRILSLLRSDEKKKKGKENSPDPDAFSFSGPGAEPHLDTGSSPSGASSLARSHPRPLLSELPGASSRIWMAVAAAAACFTRHLSWRP